VWVVALYAIAPDEVTVRVVLRQRRVKKKLGLNVTNSGPLNNPIPIVLGIQRVRR
jgi:hypothetical protein